MATVDFLEEQLELYQKQATDDSWDTAPVNAPTRFHIDDAVSLGLSILERIRRRNDDYADATVAANQLFLPREQSDELVKLYQSWRDDTAKILESVWRAEARGRRVSRADELRQAHREVRLMSFDVERDRRSIKDALEGRVKPLQEAANEFRRKRYG